MPRAGLNGAAVTESAASLADEIGLAQLTMSLLAERLGVKAPSLYKHVDGLSDLIRRIAILAANELGDDLRDAMQGRAGGDALAAGAQAVRNYVKQHPGRYAATVGIRPDGPHDPLAIALERTLVSFRAILRGYRLAPDDEVHALRMLRSLLHGFASLEAAHGFQFGTEVDESFAWMVDFIDRALRSSAPA